MTAMEWRPLSSGKVAQGEDLIAQLLGGVDDETLTSSSLVVQRDGDRFAGARAEDRRRVLAAAAGLGEYDEYLEATRERIRAAAHRVALLEAEDRPLAARAAEIPTLDRDLADLHTAAERIETSGAIAKAREAVAAAQLEHERVKDHYRRLDAATERVRSLDRDLRAIDGDIADVEQKIARTRAGVLDRRAELEQAAAQLQTKRSEITALELQQVAEADRARAAAAASIELSGLEHQLETLRGERKARIATIDEQLASIDRQERRLADAQCPVIDQIKAKALEACTFLADAQTEVLGREPLEEYLATLTDGSPEEHALAARIMDFELPDAPDTRATAQALTAARLVAKGLEANAAWAAKIPEAEAYVAQETAQLTTLQARATAKRTELDAARAAHLSIGTDIAGDGDTGTRLDKAEALVRELEQQVLNAAREIARTEGRLEELRAAAARHDELVDELRVTRLQLTAEEALASSWKVVRVQVLENEVIPGVEAIANRVLALFPYGIQLALETQRETKSDRLAETLDIRILGERAEYYEGLSGGQKTAVDFGTHVAIAIVVAQRAATRIHLLFVDEPEGLDELGRAAFARTVRWIHDEYGIRVIVASHHPDVVEHADRTLVVEDHGAEGSTARWAA